jgi:hypothetical protein
MVVAHTELGPRRRDAWSSERNGQVRGARRLKSKQKGGEGGWSGPHGAKENGAQRPVDSGAAAARMGGAWRT